MNKTDKFQKTCIKKAVAKPPPPPGKQVGGQGFFKIL